MVKQFAENPRGWARWAEWTRAHPWGAQGDACGPLASGVRGRDVGATEWTHGLMGWRYVARGGHRIRRPEDVHQTDQAHASPLRNSRSESTSCRSTRSLAASWRADFVKEPLRTPPGSQVVESGRGQLSCLPGTGWVDQELARVRVDDASALVPSGKSCTASPGPSRGRLVDSDGGSRVLRTAAGRPGPARGHAVHRADTPAQLPVPRRRDSVTVRRILIFAAVSTGRSRR
jgi:hypothetical protein